MIQLEHISKSYGSQQVLKNITAAFHRGIVYGIVGENGAGKTTLFKCIAGLETYMGAITTNNETPIKNKLGYLPTEPYYFSHMTGKEYLRLLCNARQIIIQNINDKNIFDLPLNKYVSTYSTGMKKKLALTAVLLQQNDYFIFDEPFNGVDINSNILITEIIHTLQKQQKIILLSSHIFATLSSTCNEILLLDHGKFTHQASPENFAQIEEIMRSKSVGNKLENLSL